MIILSLTFRLNFSDLTFRLDLQAARRTAANRRMGSNRHGLSVSLERKDSNALALHSGASEKSSNTGDGILHNYGTLVPEWYSLPNETTDPHTITDEHSSGGTEMHCDFINNLEGMLHGDLEIFLPENVRAASPYDFERPISNPTRLNIDSQIASISPTSPINLLNASVEANGIKQELGRIYETVMAIATSSFLSHGSNPFATKWIYHFEGTPPFRHSDVADAGACGDAQNYGVDFPSSAEPYTRPVPASEGKTNTSGCRSNDGLAEDRG